MPQFGYGLLLTAMVVALYAACASIVGNKRNSNRLHESARAAVYAVFGLLTSACLVLMYLFVTGDYSVKYVQHYSDRSMPLFYKATALWGGQDGSLLFWVTVMSVWSAIAVYQNRRKNREIMPFTIVAMMWVTLFFLATLIFAANPFQTFLGQPLLDGRGLNPLLQNAYMVTHPPTLYLGYIGWTIPFCFAMGALAHGKLDYGWIDSMRRWCLVAWVCLSIGLTLGGLWAYEELGWGGYWAWDPVENAAFFPWLTGTAFIHSIQVQERRGTFKVWNLLLITFTFILTLVGTMMTRSGIVESVHAFAQSDIGDIFLAFLVVTLIGSVGLILWRWFTGKLEPEHQLESLASREFAFLINNWVLLFAAVFVLFGTLFPSIYKWVMKGEINVGPAFYNLWMVPVGLVLLFLAGAGPLMSWRKSTGATVLNQFALPAAVGLIGGAVAYVAAEHAYGKATVYATIALALCCFTTATIVQEFYRGARARQRNSQENFANALVTLMGRAKRRYGGYIVHFGIVLMFVGFSGEAYKQEKQETLQYGEKTPIGAYDVRLNGVHNADDGQKNMMTADITLIDRATGKEIASMHPAKWSYRKPEEQVTTEVDKYLTAAGDVYLVLGAADLSARSAVLQLKFNPLVNFVWLGCAFLMFGFAVAAWPERTSEAVAFSPRVSRLALIGGTGLLSLLCAVLAFT